MRKGVTEISSFSVEKAWKIMNAYAPPTISLECEEYMSSPVLIKLFRPVTRTAKLNLRFLFSGEQDFAFTRILKNPYILPKQIFIFNLSKIFRSSKVENYLLLCKTFPNFRWFLKKVTLLQLDLIRNSLKRQQK